MDNNIKGYKIAYDDNFSDLDAEKLVPEKIGGAQAEEFLKDTEEQSQTDYLPYSQSLNIKVNIYQLKK